MRNFGKEELISTNLRSLKFVLKYFFRLLCTDHGWRRDVYTGDRSGSYMIGQVTQNHAIS